MEIHAGSLLAREVYRFEWADILRSLSVIGRLEDGRAMQVVAPSLWYVILLGQFYFGFPWLRGLLDRVGAWKTLVLASVVMVAARYLALWHPGMPHLDPGQALAYALPCRLVAPVAGMIAARWVSREASMPSRSRGVLATAFVPALALLVAATWLSGIVAPRQTFGGLVGPALPMLLALPGLCLLAASALAVPGLGRLVLWTGRRTLSLLVAQDLLRLVTGTGIAMGVPMAGALPFVMPVYIALALGITAVWDPIQARFAALIWPDSSGRSRDDAPLLTPIRWCSGTGHEAGGVRPASS
jgi:hypothetical protein